MGRGLKGDPVRHDLTFAVIPRYNRAAYSTAMTNTDSDPFPTTIIVVLLVLIAAIALGGLAMASAMHDGDWHMDRADNSTWRGGMMDGSGEGNWAWMVVPVAFGLLIIIILLWVLRPSREPSQQMPAYLQPVQQAPVQQPIAPQPYPMQPPPRPPAPQQPPRKDVAMDILEERLAKGEMSEKDYLSTLETLKKGRSG